MSLSPHAALPARPAVLPGARPGATDPAPLAPAVSSALTAGEGTARPAVVFVHGMRTSSAIWDLQLDHVRALGHEAVAVDLPAHGARRDERFSLERAFAVVDDAVASFAPGTPVVLVGLSLGGYTSLAWAARAARTGTTTAHPLVGVVAAACSSSPRGKPVALYRDVARAVVAGRGAVLRGGRRAAAWWRSAALAGGRSVAGGAAGPFGTGIVGLVGGPTQPPAGAPGWQVVTDALSDLAGRCSVADLRALRVPVWFVNGARDTMRLEEQRHLAAAADGTLVVVPRAGHDVNSHAPEAFNRVLSHALDRFRRAGAVTAV